MESLWKEFRAFLLRGNIIDLAIAVVLGTAFGVVVKALITDIFTPIIALIFGKPDFGALSFTINSSHFLYGDFLNNLFTFVVTAAAIFFFVVKPYDAYMARRKPGDDPDTKECPECTSEIPVGAKRCPLCTSQLAAT